jgi:hypothetical protein
MYTVKVYVGSKWLIYQVPNRRDHLLKVPRTLFPQHVYDEVDDSNPLDPKITFGEILCDSCSEPVNYPYVYVLILSNPWRCWGVICENCKQKYHSRKPAYIALKP